MSTSPRYLIAKEPYSVRGVDAEADDVTLMERIALGDEQALMTLYDRYSSLVFSFSWCALRDDQSAEDVLHEVFLRLWRNAKKYDEQQGSLAVWLTVITRHLAIDRLRRRREEPSPGDVTTIRYCQDHQPNHLVNIDLAKVHSILDLLPKEQRQALELAYWGGFTAAEIAAQIGEPLGTVKSRIRLALQGIRRLLLAPRTERSDKPMQRAIN